MKKICTMLILTLVPSFGCSNTLEDRIANLEEEAYLKALELQQISGQIRKVDYFMRHFGSCSEYTLLRGVKKKLEKEGIDAQVNSSHVDFYSADVDIKITSDLPIYYTLKNRPNLRNFLLADRNEKHIKQAINDLEDSVITTGNDCATALAGKGPFEHDLTAELFDLDNFDLLKFFSVQAAAEMYLLKHLIVRYQKCLNELIDINNELLSLKQEESYE